MFAEDRAHQLFLTPMLHGLCEEAGAAARIRVISARGGHGVALREYGMYRTTRSTVPADEPTPDLVVVAIDGNCSTFSASRQVIEDTTGAAFADRLVAACPDPHIERWYPADSSSLGPVLGTLRLSGRRSASAATTRNSWRMRFGRAATRSVAPTTAGSRRRSWPRWICTGPGGTTTRCGRSFGGRGRSSGGRSASRGPNKARWPAVGGSVPGSGREVERGRPAREGRRPVGGQAVSGRFRRFPWLPRRRRRFRGRSPIRSPFRGHGVRTSRSPHSP